MSQQFPSPQFPARPGAQPLPEHVFRLPQKPAPSIVERDQLLYRFKFWSLFNGTPGRRFRKDFAKRTAAGWRLVLLQQIPDGFWTLQSIVAVWER